MLFLSLFLKKAMPGRHSSPSNPLHNKLLRLSRVFMVVDGSQALSHLSKPFQQLFGSFSKVFRFSKSFSAVFQSSSEVCSFLFFLLAFQRPFRRLQIFCSLLLFRCFSKIFLRLFRGFSEDFQRISRGSEIDQKKSDWKSTLSAP